MNLPERVCRVGGSVEQFDCPRFAFKKVGTDSKPLIATLKVPPNARVVYPAKPSGSWNNTNIRLEMAIVEDIRSFDGDRVESARSLNVPGFTYAVGDKVVPNEFSTDTTTVDAPGIHAHPTPICTYYYCHKEHSHAYG